jgi:FecR protein
MRSPPNEPPSGRPPVRASRPRRPPAPAPARSGRRHLVRVGAAGVLAAVALLAAPGPTTGAAAEPADAQLGAAIALDTSQAPLDGEWVVVAAAGEAIWRPQGDGRWQPIVIGRVLPAPSEIETGATGGVTLVLGGDRLAVAPSSRLILIARRQGEDQQLRQERGRLRVDIEQRPGRAVEVRTPLLSLGIKGTSFEVAVDPWQSSILVLDGRVTVSPANGGAPVELGPRQGLTQPADLSRPARRLELPNLPQGFSRTGPVRWYLAAPAAPPTAPSAVAAVEDRAPGTTPGSPGLRASARLPGPLLETHPERRSWLGAWLDDRQMLLTLVPVAAAGLVLLIVPGLVLGRNLRERWLDRPTGKGKRRRSLIRGW